MQSGASMTNANPWLTGPDQAPEPEAEAARQKGKAEAHRAEARAFAHELRRVCPGLKRLRDAEEAIHAELRSLEADVATAERPSTV